MIVDLYAGCGGWSEGLKSLGLTDVGYEYMPEACATREAAGHETVKADIAEIDPVKCEVLIASPPCQTFSMAGTGDGRDELEMLVDRVDRGDWSTDGLDDRTRHVLIPGRWIEQSGCTTVMFEQVPPVLPVWDAYVRLLKSWGWSAWAGVLCAADFGVPQTRRRAFLIASKDRQVGPPEPTHCEGGAQSLFGEVFPWVSIAEALSWRGDERWMFRQEGRENSAVRSGSDPAQTLCGRPDYEWVLQAGHSDEFGKTRQADEPAPTVMFGHDSSGWKFTNGEIVRRLTIGEALVLQSFRADYPLKGSMGKQFLQVGNAVPPLLAGHVAAATLGLNL